jgi:hypothetical protein
MTRASWMIAVLALILLVPSSADARTKARTPFQILVGVDRKVSKGAIPLSPSVVETLRHNGLIFTANCGMGSPFAVLAFRSGRLEQLPCNGVFQSFGSTHPGWMHDFRLFFARLHHWAQLSSVTLAHRTFLRDRRIKWFARHFPYYRPAFRIMAAPDHTDLIWRCYVRHTRHRRSAGSPRYLRVSWNGWANGVLCSGRQLSWQVRLP